MYRRARLVTVLMVACSLPASGAAAGTDSTMCDDVNNIGRSGIAACTRIISAGVAKGRPLADAYYARGLKHKVNRRFDEAINDFSSAIKVDASWSWPYVARGHSYAEKGNITRAFADQETAIRFEPTAVTYVGRAMDLFKADDLDRAMADIDEALRLNPKYFYALKMRGDIHLKKREFAKATDDYNTALSTGTASSISKIDLDLVRTQLERARAGK